MNKSIEDTIKDCKYPQFRSRKKAVDYVRKMLTPYSSDSKLITRDNPIFNKLHCLLECHFDINRKLPNGETVIAFKVFYNHKGHIVTNYIIDGNIENDFSWYDCAENLVRLEKGKITSSFKKNYIRRHVLNAMRNAVASQHIQFKQNYAENHNNHFYDAITHEDLNENNVDIDHKGKTFGEIADDWLDEIESVDQVKIRDVVNSQSGFIMSDPIQKES